MGWPVKSSVYAESSPAIWNGASWPICSSTAIPRISKRKRRTNLSNNKPLLPSRPSPKSTSRRTGPSPPSKAPTGPMKPQHPPLLLLLHSLLLLVKIGPVVSLEFSQVNIEGSIKAEGSSDGRYNLADQSVEIGVAWAFNVQVTTADIIYCFIINHESTVRVLQSGVGGQD